MVFKKNRKSGEGSADHSCGGHQWKRLRLCLHEFVLREAGYRTAVFTSPHLVDMRERFAVNGEMISEEAFLQGFLAVWDALRRPILLILGTGSEGKKRHRNSFSTFMNTFSAWHYSVLQKKSPTTASLRPAWGADWMPRIMWTISS